MESGEALRQVLDKFANELALLEEELNLIHEQVGELESQLVICQQKQQSVGLDREKVLSMLSRYVPGASLSGQSAISDASSNSSFSDNSNSFSNSSSFSDPSSSDSSFNDISTTQASENKKPDNRSPIFNLMASKKKNSKEEKGSAQQPSANFFAMEQPPPLEVQIPPQANAEAEIQETVPESETKEEGESDTVKSINDALRSLFNNT